MMLSFLSAVADKAWMPISRVPPSPAQASTWVSFLPITSRAARIPEADIAAVSKDMRRVGILRDEEGNAPAIVPAQEGGMTTIVSGPRALKTHLMARAAPHPGQAVCPEHISSSCGMGNFIRAGRSI